MSIGRSVQLLLASESRELAIIHIARPDAMGKDEGAQLPRARSYRKQGQTVLAMNEEMIIIDHPAMTLTSANGIGSKDLKERIQK